LVPVPEESSDASLKRVTQADPNSNEDQKLLTKGDLDDEGSGVAEREGFEPSVEFPLHTLSKRAPSTTRTSLRVFRISRLRASGWARKPELCQKLCQTSQSSKITYGTSPSANDAFVSDILV
jgi:hypothetical protein